MADGFPVDCQTPADKLEYCQRGLELMRQLYNVMGEWSKGPISADAHAKLPVKIRERFAFSRTEALPVAAWEQFRAYFFRRETQLMRKMTPYRETITNEMPDDPIRETKQKQKEQNKNSKRWANSVFEDAL